MPDRVSGSSCKTWFSHPDQSHTPMTKVTRSDDLYDDGSRSSSTSIQVRYFRTQHNDDGTVGQPYKDTLYFDNVQQMHEVIAAIREAMPTVERASLEMGEASFDDRLVH